MPTLSSAPPAPVTSKIDRALTASVALFALAAPWSIAVAQTAFVLTALIVVFGRARGLLATPPLPWTLLAVLGFLLAQAISIPGSVHPARSLHCFDGSWVFLFPFIFWPALQHPHIRQTGLLSLIFSGGLAGIYGIVQHRQGIDWIHNSRALENYGDGGFVAVGNLSSHLTYAGVLLPIFFLALGWTLDRDRRQRVLAGTATLAIGLALVATFTRSAWVGLGAGVLILGLWRGRKAALIFGGSLLSAGVVAYLAQPALARRLASILDVQETPRWRLWQTALSILQDHLLTGAGLGSFKTQFPIYKVPGEYMSTIHPHNDLLNHSVEAGIIGGLAWSAIWLIFLRETDRNPRSFGLDGLRAGVVALLVAGSAQCYSTDEEVAQVWMFLLVIALIESGRKTEGGQRPMRQLNRFFKRNSLPLIGRFFRAKSHADATDRHATDSPATDGQATDGDAPRDSSAPKRILVVRQDNRLGNLVLMTPFLQNLRQLFPDAHIGMVTGEAFAPLLAEWPWVDEWIVQPKRRHAQRPWEFRSWVHALGQGQWDVAFEMSNHNTHSYYNCVLTLASRAPRRIGFDEPRNQDCLTDAVESPGNVVPFSLAPLALLRPLGHGSLALPMEVPRPKQPSAAIESWLRESNLSDQSYLVVHLGGRGKKSLALSAWKEILGQLCQHSAKQIVLVLGPDERDRLSEFRTGSSTTQPLMAPQLDLFDLSFLIAGSATYLGADTGVMHLAAALGTPVVSLFFQSNPYHYAPLGAHNTTLILANPYGVEENRWEQFSDATLRRGTLVLLAHDSDEERPNSDARAIEAIVQATLTSSRRSPLGPTDSTGSQRKETLQ